MNDNVQSPLPLKAEQAQPTPTKGPPHRPLYGQAPHWRRIRDSGLSNPGDATVARFNWEGECTEVRVLPIPEARVGSGRGGMNRDELIARIKKCLALSKSANEHEAAAALAMARRLMDEHGVDQTDILLSDVGEQVVKGGSAWTPSLWETYLIKAIERAIPVYPISRCNQGWIFVGIQPAPEIASYAFVTLYRQLKRARSEYIATKLKRVVKAKRKTARADAFAEGWATAVWSKIADVYPKRDLDDLVRSYLEQKHSGLQTLSPRATKASDNAAANDRGNGYVAGKQAQLHQGVGGAEQQLRLGR